MSKGVNWTGRKVLPLGKVLKLFLSYLVFRCLPCFPFIVGIMAIFCLDYCFYSIGGGILKLQIEISLLAESDNATCRPFSWGSHRPIARFTEIWSLQPANSSDSPQAPFLYKRSVQEILVKRLNFPFLCCGCGSGLLNCIMAESLKCWRFKSQALISRHTASTNILASNLNSVILLGHVAVVNNLFSVIFFFMSPLPDTLMAHLCES